MEPLPDVARLSPWEPGLFSLALYGFMVVGLVALLLAAASLLGEKKNNPEKLRPYESAKGSVRFPLDRPLPLDLIRRIFNLDPDRQEPS